MNFEQIKNKYPKAYKMWLQFFYAKIWDELLKNEYTKLTKTSEFEDFTFSLNIESLSGWLFKFFDEQGIVIVLNPDEQDKYKTWLYEICIIGHWEYIKCNFESRPKAEQAAFEKTFGILEKK